MHEMQSHKQSFDDHVEFRASSIAASTILLKLHPKQNSKQANAAPIHCPPLNFGDSFPAELLVPS